MIGNDGIRRQPRGLCGKSGERRQQWPNSASGLQSPSLACARNRLNALPGEVYGHGQSSHSAKILDFRGFDSSRILTLWGGILMSIGDFPESLSQAILAGVILVGRSIGRIAGRAGPRTATGTMRRAAQEDPLGVIRGKNAQAERGSRLTSA